MILRVTGADLAELEQDVKPCGFYHTKAKSLKEMAYKTDIGFVGHFPAKMQLCPTRDI